MNSANNNEEMFVVVDKNDNVIGKATRKECHTDKKIIHRAIYVTMIKGKEMLLQRRSMKKDFGPGALDFSVGGHVSHGETYEQAALRETEEELGIKIQESELKKIGKFYFKADYETEINMIFGVYTNIDIKNFNFNKDEISEVIYVDIEDVKRMVKNNKKQFTDAFPDVFEIICKHYGW